MNISHETNFQNNLYKIARTVLKVLVSRDIAAVEKTNFDELKFHKRDSKSGYP